MDKLILVYVLTVVIHAVDTLSYGVRLAGVRTARLATALSLFNIIVLISRTANIVQAPLLGSLVDGAIRAGSTSELGGNFRAIILSATLGSTIGALLIPTFIYFFVRAIYALETTGSVPALVLRVLSVRAWRQIRSGFRAPDLSRRRHLLVADLPRTFLILNAVIAAVYTIGVLASIYAGVLVPEFRLTASQLSGIINGGATVLFVVAVDPVAAMITDQVLAGKRPLQQVTTMVVFLAVGKIAGTIVGQIIFLPAAELIAAVTHWLVGAS